MEEKHDGEVLQEIIGKFGMDSMSFGLILLTNPQKLIGLGEDFNLSDNEKRVLKERINLVNDGEPVIKK